MFYQEFKSSPIIKQRRSPRVVDLHPELLKPKFLQHCGLYALIAERAVRKEEKIYYNFRVHAAEVLKVFAAQHKSQQIYDSVRLRCDLAGIRGRYFAELLEELAYFLTAYNQARKRENVKGVLEIVMEQTVFFEKIARAPDAHFPVLVAEAKGIAW
jgi:hypothetical protein